MSASHRALVERAAALGVETDYLDVDRRRQEASPEALAAVVEVLEADRGTGSTVPPVILVDALSPSTLHLAATPSDVELTTADGTPVPVVVEATTTRLPALPIGAYRLSVATPGAADSTCTVLAPPALMPRNAALAGGTMLFAPAYGLWTRHRPVPAIANLASLCELAARRGIDLVATLPLHAAFLDDPYEPSPYAPASRLHWNEAYADPARVVPGIAPVDADAVVADGRVDWKALGAARRAQLLAAVDLLPDRARDELERWCLTRPDVTEYARFRAERSGAPDDERTVTSHRLAQWIVDTDLAALAADPTTAGVALDLPIGCHPEGFESFSNPGLFATTMTVGAPPDTFFRGGQNWGFPPMLPGASSRSGHELWRSIVGRAGAHADLLRVDHVMGVHRLWWIPEGHGAADGVYVRYPAHELIAAIAIAAVEAATTVVGENLGTVPPEVDRLLGATATLGMHEEQFRMLGGESPGPVPVDTVTGIRTHDMAAFAVAVEDPASATYVAALMGSDSTDPVVDSGGAGPGAAVDGAAVLETMIDRLGGDDAWMVAVDLDDLIDERRPHNTPGVADPNGWSRRLDLPVDEVMADERVVRRLDLLTTARARARTRRSTDEVPM